MSASAPLSLSRRSHAEQGRLDAAMAELFQHRITFNQTLGLQIESVRHGDVRGSFAMRPELIGHYAHGRLHGGVISAVLDAVGGLAVLVSIAERHPADSTPQVWRALRSRHDRSARRLCARPGPGFVASAEVLRLGGRVATVQMRLVNDDGLLIATGCGAYMVA